MASAFSTSCGQCYYCKHALTCRCEKGGRFGWIVDGKGIEGSQVLLCKSMFIYLLPKTLCRHCHRNNFWGYIVQVRRFQDGPHSPFGWPMNSLLLFLGFALIPAQVQDIKTNRKRQDTAWEETDATCLYLHEGMMVVALVKRTMARCAHPGPVSWAAALYRRTRSVTDSTVPHTTMCLLHSSRLQSTCYVASHAHGM